MSYLSIVEKFKILFDMILDVKFIFIFLGVLVIATFLYLIKKIDNRKYIMIITLSLLLILGIDIVINYKELAEVFDNFMTIFFSNIYFPSVYVYVGTLLIVAIAFITSMFNKMLNKIYKIINGITFVMNNILLVIILNIIAKNKIDVFTPNELYTNINLVAVLEISIGLFVLWVLSLIVVYTTSVICDRIGNKRREKVVSNEVTSKELPEETTTHIEVPVETISEIDEPVLVTEEVKEDVISTPEIIETSTKEDIKETSNLPTFDDILNGRIPVDYYNNTIEVETPDIVNPQEVFENKYKEYKEKSNIESFQDIVNDANEDKVVIIKNNKAIENLKTNTVSLDSLEEPKEEINNIKPPVEEPITKNNVISSIEENKTNYTLEDYKKFISMLTELKKITHSNNVSIDDAITISLINNYSIDDCLMFKEILESNLS
jgi:membrane protein